MFVEDAYSLSKSEELQWARFVKDTLTIMPASQMYQLMVDQRVFLAELEQRLTDQYIQSC